MVGTALVRRSVVTPSRIQKYEGQIGGERRRFVLFFPGECKVLRRLIDRALLVEVGGHLEER